MTNLADEVTELEARRWEALLSSSVEHLDQLLSDGLVYTHSNGMVDTKQGVIERLASGALRYTSIRPSDQRVRLFGDVAVATGHAVIDTEASGAALTSVVRYSAVWTRENGSVRHICWHASPAKA
ncbi:nuclear transport factor 2 family protein [Planosporangium sp. 12N6]|uniref:nuclear transport factor 2 family protein n=1 Tax=Planosporangium spinosum TaxID=3402278 RepID=UPI003CF29F97